MWYTNERWKDFQSMFPNQTRSIPAIIVWSVILIADIILAAVITVKLDIPLAGRNAPGVLVAVAIFGGLFFVENFVYTKFRELFR